MPTGISYVPNQLDQERLRFGLELGAPLPRIAEVLNVSVPTLKRHYKEVIGQTELKRGPKSHVPTEAERKLVRKYAGLGVPLKDIATLIGLSKNTLRRLFDKELEHGRAWANIAVGTTLYAAATGDPTNPATVRAAIWWTKTKMGWKAASSANVKHDPRREPEPQVVVWLPDNGRGDTIGPIVRGAPPEIADNEDPKTSVELAALRAARNAALGIDPNQERPKRRRRGHQTKS